MLILLVCQVEPNPAPAIKGWLWRRNTVLLNRESFRIRELKNRFYKKKLCTRFVIFGQPVLPVDC